MNRHHLILDFYLTPWSWGKPRFNYGKGWLTASFFFIQLDYIED